MNLTPQITAEKIFAVLNVRKMFPWIEDKARLNEHVRAVLFGRVQ